ncbi:caspase family protein [Polaromonas sp. LjRoot131]|uniref:caspase family protein n=1 Tax=Polaromonas sp. LjRoot131 TaxID=3342262 RepID=UPI003ED169A0
MTPRLFLFLIAVCFWSQPAAAQGAPEPKLALLIGNATYRLAPLRTPVNDVRLMEAALKEAGFTVMKAENASLRDMQRLVGDFGDRLKAGGGVGLFYFAGHGVQVRGENFLVSTDSDTRREDAVTNDALNASTILEKMQAAGNRVNLVILDAGRENPFTVRSPSPSEGLAGMRAPSGSLVAYSTAPGSVTPDGPGRNGLYTETLARAIRQPGLQVEDVFKQVRTVVRKQSNNLQIPWENTALEGQFSFSTQPALGRPDTAALDLAFWESVKSSNSSADLQAYLSQYPQGAFAGLAQARLVQLKAAELSKASAPAVSELVGTLVSNDRAYGQKSSVAVTISQRNDQRTVYSSGDIIASGGRIEQLRVGDVVVKVTSGSLWTLPAKAGAKGEARIERLNAGSRSLGKMTWSSVDAGGGKTRIDASVAYHYRYLGVYDERVYGKWTATYSDQRDLPDSTSGRLEGLMGGRNVVSTEFTLR